MDINTPVLGPLLGLLKSRRIMFAILTFIVSVLVQYIPELESQADNILNLAAFIALVVVGGLTVTDAAEYVGKRRYETDPPQERSPMAEDNLRELIDAILDERANTRPSDQG